jgi:hypothetical protein
MGGIVREAEDAARALPPMCVVLMVALLGERLCTTAYRHGPQTHVYKYRTTNTVLAAPLDQSTGSWKSLAASGLESSDLPLPSVTWYASMKSEIFPSTARRRHSARQNVQMPQLAASASSALP